jgi:hypothetical protein
MPIPWGAIIGGVGSLFGGAARARATQEENRRNAQQQNLQRQMELDMYNRQTGLGVQQGNLDRQQRMYEANMANRLGISQGNVQTRLGVDTANMQNMLAADRHNIDTRRGIDEMNLGTRMDIDSATRQAARLEDVANLFREYGAQQNPYVSQLAGMASAAANVDSSDQRRLAGLLEGGDPYATQQRLAAMNLMNMSSPDNRAMLEAEAMRQLERSSGALDASLAARGMFSSGAAAGAQRDLTSSTLGGLAQAIAADRQAAQQMQMAGQQAAAGIYGGLGQSALAGRQAAAGIFGDINQQTIQGASAAGQMFGQAGSLTAQQQQVALGGLQDVYSSDVWGQAGMDASQYALDSQAYMLDGLQYKLNSGDYSLDPDEFQMAIDMFGLNPDDFIMDSSGYMVPVPGMNNGVSFLAGLGEALSAGAGIWSAGQTRGGTA